MFPGRESNLKPMDVHTNTNTSWRQENTPDKCKKLKSNKSSRKRKRRHSSTDDEEEDFDTSIDAKLKQSAMRNNLTPQNVRNILQKVVRNDHVLAIVKLKEEQMERHEQAMKKPKLLTAGDEVSNVSAKDEYDDFENAVPKLTRAKAKALNKYPLPVAPLKHSQPDSEVLALIHEDLHSDEDDEEYEPGEDESESDDEINTTASDIDSQPATPSSQIDAYEEPRTVYSTDGLFKIPRARNDSTDTLLQTEQEYIIAQRTRSKISLAETPIEAIESTFRAPDVPQDMYQTEPDEDDPYWMEFLNTFACPSSETEIRDEETDPDYNPMIVDSQDDRDEFQQVNVSKKEMKDLYHDMYDILDINELTLLNYTEFNPFEPDFNTSKQAPIVQEDISQSLITPVKHITEQLNTPECEKIQSQTESQATIQAPIPSNPPMSHFEPNIISTPARPNFIHQTQQQSVDSFNSSLLSVNESPVQCTYPYPYPNAYTFTPVPENSPVMTFLANSNVASNNFTLPYNSNLITTPYESTSIFTMSSSVISSTESDKIGNSLKTQIECGPTPKRPGCRSKRSRFKSATYKELENFDPNSIEPPHFSGTDERGFTFQQRLTLEEQLRMHVQLATQSYIQTYGHPEFYPEAPKIKQYLDDLINIVDKENAGTISIYNLKPAVELITKWETELSQNTKENTELVTYLQNEMNKLRKNLSYTMQFHERILSIISESKVFIYPHLLPAIPFRFKTAKSSEYFPAEDYLLAFLLEHFFGELQWKSINYKFSKPKEVKLNNVCKHISAHLNYLRHWKSIYDYIRFRRKNEIINPIKFYFSHKRAPPIRIIYEKISPISHGETFNPEFVTEPAKQPLKKLTAQWSKYAEKLIGFAYDEILNDNSDLTCKVNQEISEKKHQPLIPKKTKTSDFSSQILQDDSKLDVNGTLIHIKIIYDNCNTSNNGQQSENYCGQKYNINGDGQTLLTKYFHPIHRKKVDAEDLIILTETEKDKKTDRKYLHLHSKQINKKYRKLRTRKYFMRQKTTAFLVCIAQKLRKFYSTHWHRFRQNRNVSLAYRCVITFYRYTTEFVNCVKHQIPQISSNMSIEALVTNRRVQKILNDNVREITEENNAHIGQQHQSDGSAKRLPKNQRTSDSTRLLLLAENAQESSEKDFLFAQRFIERVEEIFINENKHHKFVEFLAILRKFSENQQHQSGADLYMILEKFLLPDYPEIIDLFLNFLSPSDAVEINKSMEYFLKLNLTKFLNKLNIFYQKQPAQIRKILTCLKELSEDPDVTFDRLRSRVLPLLKGNQLLIDWFLQCVSPDKCDNTKDEYETLILRKGNESFDDDQFEYIPQSEIVPDPNDNPCHIRYMNGRLFYGSRFPLPAKLSFGVLPCTSATVDPFDTVDKHMDSIDKSFQYRCVHNTLFADSKMRDRHQSELDHIGGNGTPEEIDNSDEEQHFPIPVERNDERNSIEEDLIVANTTSVSDNILCDNTLLRAHSIRLNPSLHSTSLNQSNADILNKLKPLEQLSAENTNKDLKLSPKKQSVVKCSTNIHAKPSHVRKSTSPNTKKMTMAACKSPNNKKTTSPILSTQVNLSPVPVNRSQQMI
ncbi:uncharacterized protein LOC116341381 isoform X2 [Contarinia nasturtii]|uniref:uncharacterized protein LOC116341381 isoform X2 n=1 Tax=Contarinia nasturtii TaxID=265458 RepID=UPI0012D3CC1A|nr:uncharacterized protein LOC116341381 isoform X2 [Contarinia nasturtii]